MRTLPKKEFKKREVEQLLKEQREICSKAVFEIEDINALREAVLNAPEPEFPAGRAYFGLMEKGGEVKKYSDMTDDQLKRRYDFVIMQLGSPDVKDKSQLEEEAQDIADERMDRQFSGKKLEKGGALENEMLDDIAWDLGISHQWIDAATGKWKSDGDKDKAYKLASVEAKRFMKGGKIKDKKESDGINWLITGE